MSIEEAGVPKLYRLRSYRMKIKEFRHELKSQLQLLGYTVIIISQIKFAGNIVLFVIRLALQSLLNAPYPTDTRLLAFMNYYRAQATDGTDPNVALRKAFKRIELVLIHTTLLLNFFVIFAGIIWPIDFEKNLEHFKMPGISHLENYPSPFNHGTGIIEGELRRHWFTQYIGERVPSSNFKGNASYLFYQLLILFFQVGLFLVTVLSISPFKDHEVADETYTQKGQSDLSDGYNGNVLILEVDPKAMIENLITKARPMAQDQETFEPTNVDAMV